MHIYGKHGGGRAATDVVAPRIPINKTAPSISGTTNVGNTLTVAPGTFDGFPAPTYEYQWYVAGTLIAGATALTYVVTLTDQEQSITCSQKATNSEGITTSTSNAIAIPLTELTPPVLVWTTASSDTTPNFNCTFRAPIVGDTSFLGIYSNLACTTLVTSSTNTFDNAEILAGALTDPIVDLTNGTYYVRVTHARTGLVSGVSNIATITITGAYAQTRVTFDGTNDGYTFNPSTPVSFGTGKKGITASWWWNLSAGDGNIMSFYSNSTRLSISRAATNKLQWQFRQQSTTTDLWNALSDGTFVALDPLTHIAISYDSVTGAAYFYVNGVAAAYTNTTAPVATGVDMFWNMNATSGLFQSGAGGSRFQGEIGDLWIAQEGINLASHISKFYGGGVPPDLSVIPASLGVTPLIHFGGTMTVANWNANPAAQIGSTTAAFTPATLHAVT